MQQVDHLNYHPHPHLGTCSQRPVEALDSTSCVVPDHPFHMHSMFSGL
jgi:hypothetical protein